MTERTCSRAFIPMTVLTCLVGVDSARAQCLEWTTGFENPGLLGGSVRAWTVFDDGTGLAVYAGGDFDVADGMTVNRVAKWNGTSWSPLGSGPDNSVDALIVFDDGSGPALYAGGLFSTAGGVSANRIAKWDGASWSALGSGLAGTGATVDTLAVYDNGSGPALYAGGQFDLAGGVSAKCIAKWNGTSWSALGSGITGEVVALAAHDDGSGPALFAGGGITHAGGTPVGRIAKWNGTSWSALGSGVSGGPVLSLGVFDDGNGAALIAGGQFATAGGVSTGHVAKWNGSSWSALAGGPGGAVSDGVRAITGWDDGSGVALYVGLEGVVEKWDGSSWSTFQYLGGVVYALSAFDTGQGSTLYAGGFAWNGSSVQKLSSAQGVGSTISALTTFDDGSGEALYAGGSFSAAGPVTARGIARWNGVSWSPLGSGIDGLTVRALAVYDDGSGAALYAAGTFPYAGGVPVNNIARWDGTWTNLGAGIVGSSADVEALAVFDDGNGPALFVGGWFTGAGGVAVSNIARVDGTSWATLGPGLNHRVHALAVYDDGSGPALFAGGFFTLPDGTHAIAKWNGTSWQSVGGGFPTSGDVHALCVFDDGSGSALYASRTISNTGVSGIQRWNGTAWSPVGSIMSYPSIAKTFSSFDDGTGVALYAGGSFTSIDGVSASRVAKWNGSSWLTLDGGLTGNLGGDVRALAVFDDGADGAPDLYAGGGFTQAGGKLSQNIAEWRGCEPGTPYCFGDGLDPVVTAPCPCTNFGSPGHGCGNSIFASGARLSASGTTNPNTLVLTLTNVPNNALATGFRNTTNANPGGVVFGDGVRCQSGTLIRFGAHNTGTLGDAPQTWTAAPDTVASGLTRYYQVQYRNPAPAFCPPGTFNVSNGYRIAW